MSEVPSDATIAAFWRWFAAFASRLADNFLEAALQDELTAHVQTLGDVEWELGPGLAQPCMLVITPDGRREWLATTQRIVGLAPAIPGWELHWAKPPKPWELQFSLPRGDGRLRIDARPWRYVLHEYPDGRFGIDLEQNNLHDADEAERWIAALVVLDGVLGETRRLRMLGDIETVAALTADLADAASSIEDLADHLASIAPAEHAALRD